MRIDKKHIAFALWLSVALMLFAGAGNDAAAEARKKKDDRTEQSADTVKKKETKYEKLFKKPHTVAEGMIDLHLVNGKVYFEMADTLFGREMIMGSTVKSISDNSIAIVGSKPSALRHFKFVKTDSTVRMMKINSDYISDNGNIASALAKSGTDVVMKSMPIAAYNADSTSVVFDMTDVFLSHDKTMSPFGENSHIEEKFQKELSYISGVKSFDDNLSVTSSLSYTYTATGPDGKKTVKDKPMTTELTRSIVLLPNEVYHPRAADYRIGVFYTERQQFGDITTTTKPVYFANRWRIEPSDTAAYRRGELVEPIKPIVFYIDKDFPEWWKPYIREAVTQWQEPFERIGFKNAVIAMDFPDDDPEFDPDNIKYTCIRYAPVNIQNAMGPSWVDPRSGEIINASVYVYHDVIKLLTKWRFIQTSQADPSARTQKLPREVLGDGLRYAISHEVGHCLGFMHNMGASSTIPVESLRDPEFTAKTGTTVSIMDYARFNYVAQPGDLERGVRLTPPRFGIYDYWLVRWTYTPVFDMESFSDETAVTSQWITDSLAANPSYRYGKQQMSTSFFDPRSQAEDLGDNAVKATEYGVSNLKYIMGNFMDWITDDEEFESRTEIFNAILSQYLTYAQHVLMNVGGLYKNEVKTGDTMPRYENVPADVQKAALKYMFTLRDDVSWLSDSNVLNRLPVIGSPEATVRDALATLIMHAPFFASMSDGVITEEFSAEECLDMIYDYVWSPVKSGKTLTDAQKSMQTTFVTELMKAGGFNMPEDSGKKTALTDETGLPDTACVVLPSGFGDNGCWSGVRCFAGELTYSPVSGYEWYPRAIFNRGTLTHAVLYAYVTKAKDLMKSRLATASALDRAHYDLLIKTIEYSLK